MTNYREILRLHSQGISQRGIASSCECSRNTVSCIIHRADEIGISWPFEKDISNAQLQTIMFPEKDFTTTRKIPDCKYIHKEMAKSGVTLSLLWDEYCQQCRQSNEIPLMYSQFCRYYRKHVNTTKATMHIERKPGEKLEVDWAGQKAQIIDRNTGEVIYTSIFVAALPYSQYAYVEAFLSQNQECWIAAHINTYKFLGGVTKILVPDNLKTGVDKVLWYTPIINKTYHEMAEYYETAVIPARVKTPKDKASVEGAVGIISTWIIAALRNQTYFTLRELNEDIQQKLAEFNEKPFQKKEGCRSSIFLEEEKNTLLPLPSISYEVAYWKTAIVQFNYHIANDKIYYSVPYEYIKHQVDVRITRNIIEIFYNGLRIASHVKLHGRAGQYSTVLEHMPQNHQNYNSWDSARFISWAKTIGPNTAIAVKAILSSHKVEQQGYRSCMGLLKLADKYSVIRLESACQKALSYTPRPNYKSIQTILQTGQDKINNQEATPMPNDNSTQFGFTRGAGYYRGKSND